jgi:hypothetical protein
MREEDEKRGFFFTIEPSSILIKRFNPVSQCFQDLDESELCAYEEGVRQYDFDSHLGAYPMTNYEEWKSLSRHITQEVIDQLQVTEETIHNAQV